jgi:hypothetical protein
VNSGPARRAARERVLRHLLEHVSGLDRDAARALLVAANADRSNGLRRLDAHLTAEPDALTSGSATVPPSMFRLLVLLERAGHSVTVPSCPGCGQRRAQLPGSSGSGRICQSCAAKQRARSCARCGRTAAVAASSQDGPICASCYARDTNRHELCGGCGQRRKVSHRRGDGTPLCGSCHRNPIVICSDCGGASRRVREAERRPLCSCGRPGRIRACARCGHERAVVDGRSVTSAERATAPRVTTRHRAHAALPFGYLSPPTRPAPRSADLAPVSRTPTVPRVRRDGAALSGRPMRPVRSAGAAE